MSKFVLMAGGTGGHLFPAMALAQELRRRSHDVPRNVAAGPECRQECVIDVAHSLSEVALDQAVELEALAGRDAK